MVTRYWRRPRRGGVRRSTRRYVRVCASPVIAWVDEVSVAKLRKAEARRSVRQVVLHLVVDRRSLEAKHYGLLGLRGGTRAIRISLSSDSGTASSNSTC